MAIGILAALIDFSVGILYGGIAGMSSRKVDTVMMRIAEIVYSIPYLLVVILISTIFSTKGSGTSFLVLVLAMCLTGFPWYSWYVVKFLQLKESDTMASISLGAGTNRIY